MNLTPKISVIVPVYKVEQYIHRCIDSILSQSFTDFELILVDDGSPDNCGKICDEYAQKDNRVRVFHKTNGGVSSARNLGLDNAIGKWVTFIDSDDYIEQGFLSIPLDASEDLLIQNYKVLKNDGVIDHVYEKKVILPSEIQHFIDDNIHKEILCVPWAKFFRNDIIVNHKICFLEGVKVGEDTLFVLDYLYYTKSLNILSLSNYVYMYGFFACKYKQTVDKSIENFNLMIIRYNKLNAKSKMFLCWTFLCCYELISPKDYKSIKKWRNDIVVKQIHSVISKDLGIKWNLLYKIFPIYKTYHTYVKIKNLLRKKSL